MDYSPAYIMSKYFIDEGLLDDPTGSSPDWPVYVGALPDGNLTDNDAVGCLDTTPVKDGRVMEDGDNIFHHGIQLILRSLAYNTGYAKIDELKENLETVNRDTVTVDGDTFRLDNVTLSTGIVTLGQEDEGSKRRELFTLNFLVTLKEI